MLVPLSDELTMVVLVPAVGAAPLLLPSEGVLGDVARSNTYPVAVAPDDGNVAADQLRLILLADDALAVNEEACAVGTLESVKNDDSLP